MSNAAPLLAVFVLAYLGFALLALSQDRHAATLIRRRSPDLSAFRPRFWGGALLIAALFVALWSEGVAFGALLWVGMLIVSSFAVVVTLSWRSSRGSKGEP